MHPMMHASKVKRILGLNNEAISQLNNEAISQLQEVLGVEGHLWDKHSV